MNGAGGDQETDIMLRKGGVGELEISHRGKELAVTSPPFSIQEILIQRSNKHHGYTSGNFARGQRT